jgi:hypothetical protein
VGPKDTSTSGYRQPEASAAGIVNKIRWPLFLCILVPVAVFLSAAAGLEFESFLVVSLALCLLFVITGFSLRGRDLKKQATPFFLTGLASAALMFMLENDDPIVWVTLIVASVSYLISFYYGVKLARGKT